ncbi:Uncharacterised protein [Citrobacter freundii]|nr:Uncharacterised protein [Citrobacter freundii]
MDLDHNVIGHRQLSTAVFGMIVLTLGDGNWSVFIYSDAAGHVA